MDSDDEKLQSEMSAIETSIGKTNQKVHTCKLIAKSNKLPLLFRLRA